MKRLLSTLVLAAVVVSACSRDKVCRTSDPSEAATCCANRKPEENNCNACSSQPTCGWCEDPVDGAPPCMGRNADGSPPAACRSGWRSSPDQCAAPKPPPGGLT